MKKRTKKGHKMEDTWLGPPYKVLKVSESGSCSLSNVETGKNIKQKVNVSQLKLYVPPRKKCDDEVVEIKMVDTTVLPTDANSSAGTLEVCPTDSQVLENQLFDDSIVRFWRTGATSNVWESTEDDHFNVRVGCMLHGVN
jgi:hypothetical protein